MTPPLFVHDRRSDGELVAEVKRLASCERLATAHLIAALAELDARRLYLGQGCSSMFTYCTQVLHLAEHAAYNRIEAARATRRFPVILTLLADGSVHLSAVRLLAPHLTQENHAGVLREASHKSKREVEQIVARFQPQPDVVASVANCESRPRHLHRSSRENLNHSRSRSVRDAAVSTVCCLRYLVEPTTRV